MIWHFLHFFSPHVVTLSTRFIIQIRVNPLATGFQLTCMTVNNARKYGNWEDCGDNIYEVHILLYLWMMSNLVFWLIIWFGFSSCCIYQFSALWNYYSLVSVNFTCSFHPLSVQEVLWSFVLRTDKRLKITVQVDHFNC